MPDNDININNVHNSTIAFGQIGGDMHGDIIAGDKTITQKITNFIFGDTTQIVLHNQYAMLDQVRQFWVDGVLEKSLHYEILLQLGKQEAADAVQHPWYMQIQEVAEHSLHSFSPEDRRRNTM